MIKKSAAFLRLKQIKQLGCLHFVFPEAIHSRHTHSLGVANNTRILLQNIFKNSQLPLTPRSVRFIYLAEISGLVHDIGHGPYSHAFDRTLEKIYVFNNNHEMRGAKIIRHYFGYIFANKIQDLELIISLIMGGKDWPPEWQDYYWARHVVATPNSNEIDVDRLDYIVRDALSIYSVTGQQTNIPKLRNLRQARRNILANSRLDLANRKIVYPANEVKILLEQKQLMIDTHFNHVFALEIEKKIMAKTIDFLNKELALNKDCDTMAQLVNNLDWFCSLSDKTLGLES